VLRLPPSSGLEKPPAQTGDVPSRLGPGPPAATGSVHVYARTCRASAHVPSLSPAHYSVRKLPMCCVLLGLPCVLTPRATPPPLPQGHVQEIHTSEGLRLARIL
jgi:hypothetical protein